MELYAFYESDEERQAMIALESAEISLDRALLAYKAIMESREINLREAELRCVMENGDACTLMDFYEDAQQQTGEQQKGVLATIWDKILQFIDRIKKALGIGQKEDDQEYGVSSNTNKFIAGLKQAWESIKKFVATPIKGILGVLKGARNILAGLTVGAVVIVGGKIVMDKLKKGKGGDNAQASSGETVQKMKGSEINGHLKFLSTLCDNVKNGVNSVKSKFGGNNNNQDSDVSGEGSGVISFFTKKVNEIRNHLKNAPSFADIANKATDTIDQAGKAVNKVTKAASKQAEAVGKNVQKGAKAVKATADAAGGATKSIVNNVVDTVTGALSKLKGDQADMSSSDEFGMTKDFAELLASDEYTESADEEELAEMLAGII